MKSDDPTIAIVREWIAKAENDLIAAVQLLKLGRQAPADVVCFHAQQCAEKYIKGALVHRGISFSKTHDLELLVRSLPNGLRARIAMEDLTLLTPHATGSRYPGGATISVAAARRALAASRRVRSWLRAHLPRRSIEKLTVSRSASRR
jgi:HEPN domain-containing protein